MCVGERPGDALQHPVALFVADEVVEQFEVVDIEVGDRQRRCGAGSRPRFDDELVDEAAVGAAGEGIGVGQLR